VFFENTFIIAANVRNNSKFLFRIFFEKTIDNMKKVGSSSFRVDLITIDQIHTE